MNKLPNISLEKIDRRLDYLSKQQFSASKEAYENRIENTDWLYETAKALSAEVKWLRSLIEMASYDLEWYPDRLNQVKRQLEYNVQKWEKKEMIE
tara:strand:- start:1350 stop:1634 length:285 start_codon:yes stop_codon:yes gene_type:complete